MGLFRRRANGRAFIACAAVLALSGCSSSSSPEVPTIRPARQFELTGFTPLRVPHAGPTRLSFAIRQPSGAPLTSYRRGAGPHTGIHLIVVRDDLGVIIHRHPPVAPNGRVVETLDLPSPGPYRVLVDAYPALKGRQAPRNFQLHEDVRVAGNYRPRRLPRFSPVATDEGYRVSLRVPRQIHPIEATTLTASVTDPNGRPVRFKPWFGALAHAIFFRAASLDYFHTHVCGPSTPGCTSVLGGTTVVGRPAGPGQLHIGLLLPVAGTWRLFLQFRDRGRVVTAPFTLRVQ
jgi:hypothetical protein